MPGESHGQRSLMGYSSPGRKESDMTEWLCTRPRAHTHTHTHTQCSSALVREWNAWEGSLALKMEEGSHEPRSMADSRHQWENSTMVVYLQGTEFCPRPEWAIKEFSPRASRKEHCRLTLWFSSSETHTELLICTTQIINVCHFKPLCLWQFVVAAVGNDGTQGEWSL